MPKGATSYKRERFRSQPYGSRSAQGSQQSVFGGSFANNSEAQPSMDQPVDQAAAEAPNNDTGDDTNEFVKAGWKRMRLVTGDFTDHDAEPSIFPTKPGAFRNLGPPSLDLINRLLPRGHKFVVDTEDNEPDAPTNAPADASPADAPTNAPADDSPADASADAAADAAADVPVNAGPSEPPRGPRCSRPRYDSYRPRELKMVNSMVLQSISRTNSRAPPSISIYNNSRGGGVQDNVFTKVPSTSKTISFRVDSEETLLQAYRHVKAMNPSAPVGGIMFSVPPETEKHEYPLFTEVNNIRWNALTGRQNSQLPRGVNIFRNRDGGFTINH